MSDFHYVRTEGSEGGVDAAEGPAIGLDLAHVLDEGLPPFRIAVQILADLAEILAIAEEDGVVHGDIQLTDVTLDETAAVSLEGFDRGISGAPEPQPSHAADRYGLGAIAFALLAGRPFDIELDTADQHENATIDAVLAIDLTELPEDVVGDLQWYVARLLAWDPNDRPPVAEAWQAFGRMADTLVGPAFSGWCNDALEGGGQRRDRLAPVVPAIGDEPSRTDGPMRQGSIDFEAGGRPAAGRSTGAWTRDGMKEALQRVLASDYLEDPNTDWMPGTPIPPMERDGAPAADDFRTAPKKPRPNIRGPSPAPAPMRAPKPPRGPEDDRKTEVGSLAVPTTQPERPRRFAPDPPTVPAPVSEAVRQSAPSRPRRGPAADPDTSPQLVARPTSQAPPPPADPPLVAEHPAARPDTPPPAEPDRLAGPLPDVQLPKGPDPFADMEEESNSNLVVWGALALFVVVATGFCLGVGGVGGVAVFGLQANQGSGFDEPSQTRQVAPRPRATPAPRRDVAPSPRPSEPSPRPRRVQPTPSLPGPTPAPRPSAPAPSFGRSPAPSLPPPQPVAARTTPAPAMPMTRPKPVAPAPMGGVARGFDTPPAPVSRVQPDVPSLPIGEDDSLVDALLPDASRTNPDYRPTQLQDTMRAHLVTATAARDAVIRGDAEAARVAAKSLEFINAPANVPPSWMPYITDMKMEAWLMENSPDIPAAAFKVAQLGQSCATCHAGVRAGPTVRAADIPPRTFNDSDIMKQHAWASDWMWVGLLANDPAAWSRGATELDRSPFPSVSLAEFPEQRFMDLEDKLHQLAAEAKAAQTHQDRGRTYGKILATCSRCHDAYREVQRR